MDRPTWLSELTRIVKLANWPGAAWIDYCLVKKVNSAKNLQIAINKIYRAIPILYAEGDRVTEVLEKPNDPHWTSVVSSDPSTDTYTWRQPLKHKHKLVGRIIFIRRADQTWDLFENPYRKYKKQISLIVQTIRWQNIHNVKAEATCYKMIQRATYQFRNPMHGLITTIGALEKTHMAEHQKELLKVAKENAYWLLSLSNDMLDLATLELGQIRIRNETVDLWELINEAWKIVIDGKPPRLPFTIWLEPGISEKVTTDRSRVRQILVNLLSNSYKFTERGGICVRVSTSDRRELDMMVEKDLETPWGGHRMPNPDSSSSYLRFDVLDTGCGMTEEAYEKLFQSFQQSDLSQGGSGLGLSLVYKICELMGGAVELWSRPKLGTRMTFVIPAEPVPGSITPFVQVRQKVFMLGDASSLRSWSAYVKADVRECVDISRAWHSYLANNYYDAGLFQITEQYQEVVDIVKSVAVHPKGQEYRTPCIALGSWPALPPGNELWVGFKAIIPGTLDWRFSRVLGRESANLNSERISIIPNATKKALLWVSHPTNFRWLSQMLVEHGFARIIDPKASEEELEDLYWIFIASNDLDNYRKWRKRHSVIASKAFVFGLATSEWPDDEIRVVRIPPTEVDIDMLIRAGQGQR